MKPNETSAREQAFDLNNQTLLLSFPHLCSLYARLNMKNVPTRSNPQNDREDMAPNRMGDMVSTLLSNTSSAASSDGLVPGLVVVSKKDDTIVGVCSTLVGLVALLVCIVVVWCVMFYQ